MVMLTLHLFLFFPPFETSCPPKEHLLEPLAFLGCQFASQKTDQVFPPSRFPKIVVNLLRQRQMTTVDKRVYNYNIRSQTHVTHKSREPLAECLVAQFLEVAVEPSQLFRWQLFSTLTTKIDAKDGVVQVRVEGVESMQPVLDKPGPPVVHVVPDRWLQQIHGISREEESENVGDGEGETCRLEM